MEYRKDFDGWNKRAKILNGKRFTGIYHERDIWWCAVGINVGSELDGKNEFFERPVLIIRKFNNETVWILPLISKGYENIFYIPLESNGNISYLNISQLRNVSLKRFRRFIRKVSTYEFAIIQGRVMDLFKYK